MLKICQLSDSPLRSLRALRETDFSGITAARYCEDEMLKTVIVMMLAVSAGTVGDILLAKGMKELGDISTMNLRGILNVAFQALTTPKLIMGTAMLTIFFMLWLAVLSWEDLSVALPMQALNYVLVAFLSQYFLGEIVTPMRWAGTVLVCIGVVMITRSGGA
jgi:drug/metabolite transporter (DMT)-like permease